MILSESLTLVSDIWCGRDGSKPMNDVYQSVTLDFSGLRERSLK